MSNIAAISDVMEFLVANAASNLPPEALADVFDRLTWCLADNGHEICVVRDVWLMGDDRRKVEIALMMEETFPFDGGRQMRTNLKSIASRWPEFARRCE